MTEQEKQEFLELIEIGDGNHYEVLGLIPFTDYNNDKYIERDNYIRTELASELELKNDALELINNAKVVLKPPRKKKQYDAELKPKLEKKIIQLIEFAVKKDTILDGDERDAVEEQGEFYGFTLIETKKLIEEQRKIYNFIDGPSNSQKTASTTTASTGFPQLKIHNNTNYAKNGKFVFDNVKLTETREETITIINGGGGTLVASANWSKKWIEVTPNKIHQNYFPQEVTIIINPSKDPSLKNGAKIRDTIYLNYISSSGSSYVPIVIDMTIEGHFGLVTRQSKKSTIVSSIIVGITLMYFFSNYYYSGWEIFGFVLSTIVLGLGINASMESKSLDWMLIPGGIILLITNWTIFTLLLTILITWKISKLIFEKYPFRNELVALIPLGSFVLFLTIFLTSNDLKSINSSFKNTSNSVVQPNNKPTISTASIVNRLGYISANKFANIRYGNSTNHKVISTKKRGESVYVIEKDLATGWFKVTYNKSGSIGYISGNLVSFSKVAINEGTKNPKNENIVDRFDKKNHTNVENIISSSENNNEILNYPDGEKYVGSVKNNKKDGQGTYYFASGARYVGSFKNDLKIGKGILYFSDGSRCEGVWKNDLRHGNFVYYDKYNVSKKQVFDNGSRFR